MARMKNKRTGSREAVVGITCEHNRIALTLARGGEVRKSVWADVGENIVDGAEIKSRSLFAAQLKELMREQKISCRRAAFALPGEDVFTRTITMPKMDDDQIRINVPFEFRDFIQGELKDYVFDYAYLPTDGAGIGETGEPTVTLFAAAVPRSYLEETKAMFRMAGLRLVKVTPELCAYESLLGLLPSEEERNKERCFLDIGNGHSRMLVYKNGRYKLMHMIDIGERRIVQTIADEMNVDMHIAMTYLMTRYEGCDRLPAVENAYKDISLEVLKGLNFYEVSDMSARLADVTLCGGGAMIAPLVELLKERITMEVVTVDELLPEWNTDGMINITAPSLGLVV